MEELLPGIFTWHRFSERHGYDFNGYLVEHPEGNLCIDPVEMSEETLERLAEAGVARILITNRNHVRASMRVRARTRAPIAIHPADAGHAGAQGATIDEDLVVGATVGPFQVLAAGGKSAGEVALHWPERRLLVVGDVCVGNPPGACALLPAAVIDEPGKLRESLRKLAAIDFDTLLTCDGAPILQGAREALRTLTESWGAVAKKTL